MHEQQGWPCRAAALVGRGQVEEEAWALPVAFQLLAGHGGLVVAALDRGLHGTQFWGTTGTCHHDERLLRCSDATPMHGQWAMVRKCGTPSPRISKLLGEELWQGVRAHLGELTCMQCSNRLTEDKLQACQQGNYKGHGTTTKRRTCIW